MKSIILLLLLSWIFVTYCSNRTALDVPEDLQPEEDDQREKSQQPEQDLQHKEIQQLEEDQQSEKYQKPEEKHKLKEYQHLLESNTVPNRRTAKSFDEKERVYFGDEASCMPVIRTSNIAMPKLYTGKMNVTAYGEECQMWNATTPNEIEWGSSTFPQKEGEGHNYCRDPSAPHLSVWNSAWCYTTDPENVGFKEVCSIPNCPIPGISKLKQDGNVANIGVFTLTK